jgi:hypothetical protein
MNAIAAALFILVAIVNFAPVVGVLSTDRLEALYGVVIDEPNLAILMRHRAVLFSFVGALLMAAAFYPALRSAGLTVGLISMLSFVAIALMTGEYNPALRRVVLVDVVASVALIAGFILGRAAPHAPGPA